MTDWREDGQAAQELEQERAQAALDALMECKRAGANLGDLKTLAVEMGLRSEWESYQQDIRP